MFGRNAQHCSDWDQQSFTDCWLFRYERGFLDTGGSFTTIDVPDSNYTFPFGINGAGQIVGFFGAILCEPKKPTHGFLYSGGSFNTIDVPGATQTCAYGI